MRNWENLGESYILNIGVEQFWNQTFEETGIYNIREFLDTDENFYDCKTTQWDQYGQQGMTYKAKVEGVPYIDSTRIDSTLTQKIKTDKTIVLDILSKTLDLPMSD